MIARRSLLIIANKAAGTLIGFLGIFFIFRYMDKSAFGMYAFTFGLVGFFQLINGVGVNAAHVKRISSGNDEAEANATFLLFRLTQLAIFVAVVGSFYAAMRFILPENFAQTTTPRILLLMLLVYVILSLRQIFDFSFRAHRRVATGETVLFVDSLITALGFFTVSQVWRQANGGWVPFPNWSSFWADLFGIHGPLTIEEGAALQTVAFLLGTLTSFLVAGAFFLLHRYPIGRPTWTAARAYFRFAWPVAIISIMTVLYTHLDTIFLGFFWDAQAVADYRSTLKLMVPALVFGQAVWVLLFPSVSDHHSRQEMHVVANLVTRSERYLSMTLVGILMLPLVFATETLRIAASQAYLSAAPTLQALTLYVFFASMILPAKSILLGTGRPLHMARVGLLITGLAVFLNLLFVPRPGELLGLPTLGLGAPGAALGTGLALAAAYVYLKVLARRLVAIPWLPVGLGRQLTAGVLAGLTMWSAKMLLGVAYFDRFYKLGAAGVVGLLVYWFFLVLLREFGRREWALIMDAAHPGKMGRYMGGELRGRRDG